MNAVYCDCEVDFKLSIERLPSGQIRMMRVCPACGWHDTEDFTPDESRVQEVFRPYVHGRVTLLDRLNDWAHTPAGDTVIGMALLAVGIAAGLFVVGLMR